MKINRFFTTKAISSFFTTRALKKQVLRESRKQELHEAINNKSAKVKRAKEKLAQSLTPSTRSFTSSMESRSTGDTSSSNNNSVFLEELEAPITLEVPDEPKIHTLPTFPTPRLLTSTTAVHSTSLVQAKKEDEATASTTKTSSSNTDPSIGSPNTSTLDSIFFELDNDGTMIPSPPLATFPSEPSKPRISTPITSQITSFLPFCLLFCPTGSSKPPNHGTRRIISL